VRKIIFITWLILVFFKCTAFAGAEFNEGKFVKMRRVMVAQQILTRGVKDQRVIQAMLKVPRHKFVPFLSRSLSYADSPLFIGGGQTISQPYIVALITELLALEGEEKVLEVGTGSGYQAAILAELAKEVYTVEILESLAKRSRKLLASMGYENIKVKCADGYQGWKEFAPFDAIIVTCAPPAMPQELFDQLKEGGKMVVPVGEVYQELILITKENGQAKERNIIPVRFVPMVKGSR